ncbi:MAG TPA: aconitase family protein [Anaeromyxobacteraceae bacterium]|jgi:aconitate hydratase/homoaconitate hydratase|nr:aconitase family protein [Anaeromyxobacteraceae bacterium]
MTLTQKILADHAVGLARPWVEAGDVLRVRVDWTIASELAWNGMERTWAALGRPPPRDPARFFLAVDHTVDPVTLAHDPRAQRLAELSRSFARSQRIVHFHDANETILHTRFYRELVEPGQVVLGADSHTSSHGGLGAFAIGLGGADVTAAMVLGESWIEVPEAIAVDFRGAVPFGLSGKDVVLRTLALLRRNAAAMERTVEYRGDVAAFTTDMRFTVCNMTAELGGLNGIFEPDGTVAAWLSHRPGPAGEARFFRADEQAPYSARYPVDLDRLSPQVARPFSPDNVFPVEEVAGQRLDGVFIGACTTTEEELAMAGLVLEAALAGGRAPAPAAAGRRVVVPGDLAIQRNLQEAGLWAVYERAGFAVDPPGCSMCLGIASRKAGPGEVWLSSQNRNFRNRMGEGSLAWLASAATVAASALELELADPRPLLARVDPERLERILGRERRRPLPEVREDQPRVAVGAARGGEPAAAGRAAVVRGQVQRFGDAVDTDAIIPGEFCHLKTVAELGERCFHHVRPEFVERARGGATVVVGGEGWGTGSSREQAVWALQGAGVAAVVAKSYAFIHKRNLVNEALPFLVVRDEAFYALAAEGRELEVDLARGEVRDVESGRTFRAEPATAMVRALQSEGGLVPAVQRHGPAVFDRITGG